MQPPAGKQHVRARLESGLWLTGQYFNRHPQLDGKPGYSLVVGRINGRPFAGPYHADRVVEWELVETTEQLQLFNEAA